MKINHQLKFRIALSFIALSLAACTGREELLPEWAIKTQQNSQVFIMNSNVLLRDADGLYKIDIDKGEKQAADGLELVPAQGADLGKSNKDNPTREWLLEKHKGEVHLIETFKETDDCQLSLHEYEIQKLNGEGRRKVYKLGSNRYYVQDFAWDNGELYIIKSLSSGGDAYFLEKYTIN